MTLEKLLIFGFAIAAIGGLVATGTSMTTERKASVAPYQAEVGKMVEKTQ